MKIPESTYRLQFTPEFNFDKALTIIEYLADLGISHIYASPVFKAVPGSTHGYDIVDPTSVNDELGGMDGLDKLFQKCREKNIGWIQDIVPNHMAVHPENKWLMDVLEKGAGSEYFGFFDINWDHFYESINGRLLAPFLGAFYGETIDRGEIALKISQNGLTVNYYDVVFPLRIESYKTVLCEDCGEQIETLDRHHPDSIDLIGTVEILNNLPPEENPKERANQIAFGKKKLWDLYDKSESIKKYIDRRLELFNGNPDDPKSFDRLDRLLGEQHFRLSFWKVATEEINYRRFFTINSLICMKLGQEEVFHHTHKLVRELIESKKIDGIRIDHLDGLYDPGNYLERLREMSPDAYIIAEKIVEPEEIIPSSWNMEGLTGYESLNMINGLFCKRSSRGDFRRMYARIAKITTSYDKLVAEKKRLIAMQHLAGDVDNLAHSMKKIASRDRHGNDIALYGLRRAIIEMLAWFPVYRSYVNSETINSSDKSQIDEAHKKALENSPDLAYELRLIHNFLLLRFDTPLTEKEKADILRFVMRFQQLSGPLMAKGFEDTFLYLYNLLISLNEVGGSPEKFGFSREEFNTFCSQRTELYPHSLNTLTTHDTKRSEDVRARVNVLSEMPKEWNEKIKKWMKLNRSCKRRSHGSEIPDKNDEYLLYQTLIGTYPFNDNDTENYIRRIKDYVIKAVREAKIHTAWLKPDDRYENAFVEFVDKIFDKEKNSEFIEDFQTFQPKIAFYGIFNSLSQSLLKLTIPGVPDFYQGSEIWDLRLVDPDNRGPVDFDRRLSLLNSVKEYSQKNLNEFIKEALENSQDGRIKLYLIHETLNLRRRMADLYSKGEFMPLQNITGSKEKNIIAFARRHKNQLAVTIVPRFLFSLVDPGQMPLGETIWSDTEIELPDIGSSKWYNVFTGEEINSERSINIATILNRFPVALLTGEKND